MKNFRARHGLLQNEVAKAIGVSTETIRRYQDNECKPGKRNLPKLRAFLGLSGELDRYFK
ncbi:MAG: helix-turn-helix transcriptional regulator [Elusimicrobia bacterium]|nr:helix-turn-helix transcriptional regulator [Elusimicrobiota bacterium]